jgi:hypothetical protein
MDKDWEKQRNVVLSCYLKNWKVRKEWKLAYEWKCSRYRHLDSYGFQNSCWNASRPLVHHPQRKRIRNQPEWSKGEWSVLISQELPHTHRQRKFTSPILQTTNLRPILTHSLAGLNKDPDLPRFKISTLHLLLKELGFVQEANKSKAISAERECITLAS